MLKELAREKIFDIIKAECERDKWKILILDNLTTRLLSACCKMSEVMRERILLIEDISKVRAPMIDNDAIYFISPNTESVRRLIDDFSPGKKPYKCENHV